MWRFLGNFTPCNFQGTFRSITKKKKDCKQQNLCPFALILVFTFHDKLFTHDNRPHQKTNPLNFRVKNYYIVSTLNFNLSRFILKIMKKRNNEKENQKIIKSFSYGKCNNSSGVNLPAGEWKINSKFMKREFIERKRNLLKILVSV